MGWKMIVTKNKGHWVTFNKVYKEEIIHIAFDLEDVIIKNKGD